MDVANDVGGPGADHPHRILGASRDVRLLRAQDDALLRLPALDLHEQGEHREDRLSAQIRFDLSKDLKVARYASGPSANLQPRPEPLGPSPRLRNKFTNCCHSADSECGSSVVSSSLVGRRTESRSPQGDPLRSHSRQGRPGFLASSAQASSNPARMGVVQDRERDGDDPGIAQVDGLLRLGW